MPFLLGFPNHGNHFCELLESSGEVLSSKITIVVLESIETGMMVLANTVQGVTQGGEPLLTTQTSSSIVNAHRINEKTHLSRLQCRYLLAPRNTATNKSLRGSCRPTLKRPFFHYPSLEQHSQAGTPPELSFAPRSPEHAPPKLYRSSSTCPSRAIRSSTRIQFEFLNTVDSLLEASFRNHTITD